MADDLPGWLGAEESDAAPRRPRRRLLLPVVAGLPWLVLLALLLSGGLSVPATSAGTSESVGPELDAAPPEEPGPAGTHGHDEPRDEGEPDATEGLDAPLGDPPADPSSGSTPDARPVGPAAHDGGWQAMALAVARAWLTDVGPALPIEGMTPQPDRYLEHATVERIDHDGDRAVATVQAVVLERDGEAYAEVALRRLAVPMREHDGMPRPAGAPWWLPDPSLEPHPPEGEPEDDPDVRLQVAEALTDAGLSDAEPREVTRIDDDWWVAEIHAELPDGRVVDGPVWLRSGPGGPIVAGTRSATPPPSTPPDDPAEESP